MAGNNDGGVVAALVLLVGALALGLVGSTYLYVMATPSSPEGWAKRMLRLLSGWANIGNAIIHALLTFLLVLGDTQSFLDAGVQDADNPAGPVFLLILNGALGIRTIRGGGPLIPFCWNTFVAISGSLIPMVWLQFFAEGLENWPYSIVFLWLGIYAFESMALFTTAALYLLPNEAGQTKKD